MKAAVLPILALLAAGCSHCPVCGASWGAAERERAEVKEALRENKAASAASGLGSFGSLLDAALKGDE